MELRLMILWTIHRQMKKERPVHRRLATFSESVENFINSLSNATNNLFKKNSLAIPSYNNSVEISEPCVNPEAWDISINEYGEKYHTFDKTQFEKQRNYLSSFCKECQHKRIKLLLVNMPLPEEHLRLLPSKAYAEYCKAIAETGKLPGVSLLDIQRSDEFPNAFFADVERLNVNGGHALNLLIANRLLALNDKKPNIIDGLSSWWLAKRYFEGPKPPDIVILGGSQLGPLLGC